MIIQKYATVVLLWLIAVTGWSQKNIVDEVVWVVGDSPILLSDIEEARISQEMNGQAIDNPYCTIPEQIAIEKLFLHQAELDSIEVDESRVIEAADEQVNYYIQQCGSRENLEAISHKSIQQLREMYKDQTRNGELVRGVQDKLTSSIKVTPAEVREYFKDVPEDSLPFIPTQVEVQILTSVPKVSREEVERIEEQLREYARRVNSGESDFSTLALLYSQDGSSRMGGELGYKGRGQFVDEFANVAFALNDPKKVSKIVKTEFGYHIIQLIDKRGDKINCRHILLKPEIEESEFERCIARLDSIATDIREEKFSFEDAAFSLSADKDTRNNYGLMVNKPDNNEYSGEISSRFQMKDLPQDVAKVVDSMKVGEISKAFRMINKKGQEVCAIVKLKNRIEGHKANMTEDFQILKEEVMNKRREAKIDQWINEKLKTTYVRINPDWRNCKFHYSGWIK